MFAPCKRRPLFHCPLSVANALTICCIRIRVVVVGFYFGSMTLMEGKGISEAQSRLEKVCLSSTLRQRSFDSD